MFVSIGFIGAGRIAKIMLEGWTRAGALPGQIVLHDQSDDAVRSLVTAYPSVHGGTLAEAAGCDLVFGALHPPAMLEALPAIVPALKADTLFCSLAPKIKLATLRDKLGGFDRLARMNPNAPSIVNKGFNPVAFADGLPAKARQDLLAVMAPLGQTPEVEEQLIESYAVISAMGPTYFWFQFDAVRHLAETFGLMPEDARTTVAAMLHGAVDTLLASGLPEDKVMDLVPVRPMAEDEPAIRKMIDDRLAAMFAKLKG
ncbi:NAD(P)-binding domain-containing protein [Telmatospirillum sp.]|uniref:pyrroline-5-carboxylate reductase family protein n=1 Tax=Telmatospirillum sp. TaxID=2079197 RepID=UPI00284486A9|nr:NAD(P)-binding domain-containing protein [Telmatospirillum sp.]MDR3438418.1 NAD(P)-binding domain-containing protein [Telmatospirillum sp.]